jgi:hypothetical protein
MAQIGFHYGALSKALEEQAIEQGYTLGDRAETLEKLAYGLVLNHIHGILTDSAYDKALQRLHKKVVSQCKPLRGDGY